MRIRKVERHSGLVTAQFSKEEKVAVKEGMRLLAAEEAGVQLGDEDQEAGVGEFSLFSFS